MEPTTSWFLVGLFPQRHDGNSCCRVYLVLVEGQLFQQGEMSLPGRNEPCCQVQGWERPGLSCLLLLGALLGDSLLLGLSSSPRALTSSPFSFHLSILSFGCLMHHLQGLQLYLDGGARRDVSVASCPTWTTLHELNFKIIRELKQRTCNTHIYMIRKCNFQSEKWKDGIISIKN